jgi:transposase
MHTWCEDAPLHLVEKQVSTKDPEAKAIAWYGLYLPTGNQMLLRFVGGRPVSRVTCLFLAWLTTSFAAQGKRALVLIWDNASWHISQEVRQWIRVHNRTVKRGSGCRLIMCRLPSKSPWLNPIEPKWVHGKRAVSEPVRTLSVAELRQRICTYYNCALEDLIVQEGC